MQTKQLKHDRIVRKTATPLTPERIILEKDVYDVNTGEVAQVRESLISREMLAKRVEILSDEINEIDALIEKIDNNQYDREEPNERRET